MLKIWVTAASVIYNISVNRGKGEEGDSLRVLSILTTLMVVWKLLSGVRVVYVLGWEHQGSKGAEAEYEIGLCHWHYTCLFLSAATHI